jgi:hypothetical protein
MNFSNKSKVVLVDPSYAYPAMSYLCGISLISHVNLCHAFSYVIGYII